MKYTTTIIVLIFLITGCSNQTTLNIPDESIALGNHILQTRDGGLIITGQNKKIVIILEGGLMKGVE